MNTCRNTINCSTILLSLFLFVSCKKDNGNSGTTNNVNGKRTVIVYMVANNNLDYFAYQNINAMERGWDSTDGNLIVYIEGTSNDNPAYPVVYKIKHDTTDQIVSPIQWVYPSQNACSPSVFSSVINDIETSFPSSSFGLVMWSHGTGWYPPGTQIKSSSGNILDTTGSSNPGMVGLPIMPLTKSFGRDGINEMDIVDLKNALHKEFDFIAFDACYMGGIEVAYELKDKAQYIISSPTEVLSYGFPYKQIMPFLFSSPLNASAIANGYVSFYQNQNSSVLRSASISVVNTSKFPDLISTTNKIFANMVGDTLNKPDSIQQFDVYKSNLLYDIVDLYHHINISEGLQTDFQTNLNALVEYKQSTVQILGQLPINKFSGLSSYFINNSDSAYYEYYKKLDWCKESGYGSFLDKFVTIK